MSEGRVKEIAARTVNRERARSGESKTASRSSINDISPSRRGGLRSHAIGIRASEPRRSMALCGAASLAELDRSLVRAS